MAESKLDWSEADTLTPEQMNRIESIVDNIKNGIAEFYGVKTFNDAVIFASTLNATTITSQDLTAGTANITNANFTNITGTNLNFTQINNKPGQDLYIDTVKVNDSGYIEGAVFGT